MEKKGFKWQMAVELVFMVSIIIALFLPAFTISGEKYLETAVDINEYAKDQDSKTASEAQVDKKVINKYKKNTSSWDDKVKEFDDEIDKADKGSSISQIMYVKWLLTADDEIDDIKGINKAPAESSSKKDTKYEKKDTNKSSVKKTKQKNKRKATVKNKKKKQSSNSGSKKEKQTLKKLSDSNLKIVLKFMSLFVVIPVLLAIAGIILVIVTGKTNPVFLIASGTFVLLLKFLNYMVIPRVIWNTISDYVRSLTLVDEKVLAIDDVGRYSVNKMLADCTGIGMYITLASAVILIILGILFMTVLKPKTVEEPEDMEWDFGIDARQINHDLGAVQNQNDLPMGVNGYSDISNDYAGNFTVAGNDDVNMPDPSIYDKGYIYGVKGQYKLFNLQIESGEELILGRDPRQAMLIFDYPKVSRKHCGIRYDSSTGGYYVIDYSSNGIELSDGTEAKAGEYVSVAPGTIVYLAGRHEALKLG